MTLSRWNTPTIETIYNTCLVFDEREASEVCRGEYTCSNTDPGCADFQISIVASLSQQFLSLLAILMLDYKLSKYRIMRCSNLLGAVEL